MSGYKIKFDSSVTKLRSNLKNGRFLRLLFLRNYITFKQQNIYKETYWITFINEDYKIFHSILKITENQLISTIKSLTMLPIIMEEIDIICLIWTNHASFASESTVQSIRPANCEEMNDVATIRSRYVSFSLFALHF